MQPLEVQIRHFNIQSAETTEDSTPENSGPGESSVTSEKEHSDPVQESVVETRCYQSRQNNLQIGLHNSYIDIYDYLFICLL